MIPKNKPYRSKAFMRFCHEHMMPTRCCVCGEQATELHHFGDDGGQGMKPSDNEIARLCNGCHQKHGHKKRSLIRNMRYILLSEYQDDALELNRAYMKHLEGKK